MSETRRQVARGDSQLGGALDARSYSTQRAGEIIQLASKLYRDRHGLVLGSVCAVFGARKDCAPFNSIRAAARELVIAMAVSMSCAVSITLVVVGWRLWKALNF